MVDESSSEINDDSTTDNVIETEIKHINDKLERHSKIFWWIGTVVLGVVVVSIVESVMK